MKVSKSASSIASADPRLRPTSPGYVKISVRGKTIQVPSAHICGRTVTVTGRWIKMAKIRSEELVEGEPVSDPESFASELKNTALNADIFTFGQRLPDVARRHNYHCEWDNLAVIAITTFEDWWARLSDSVQRAVKKAKRVGVVVKEVEFNDALVRGIQGVYNETPVRRGTSFWHYQKDFDTVKAENSTFAERSTIIGAYHGDELIAFIRMIHVGKIAEIIQILSQKRYQDKRPTNALIAKAVELCEQKGVSHLVYCNYVYQDPKSSLTEFKRRNRFEKILVPRYYIPLTFKGRMVLKMKLHHGIKGLLPPPVVRMGLKLRSWFYEGIVMRLKSAGTRRDTEPAPVIRKP